MDYGHLMDGRINDSIQSIADGLSLGRHEQHLRILFAGRTFQRARPMASLQVPSPARILFIAVSHCTSIGRTMQRESYGARWTDATGMLPLLIED